MDEKVVIEKEVASSKAMLVLPFNNSEKQKLLGEKPGLSG